MPDITNITCEPFLQLNAGWVYFHKEEYPHGLRMHLNAGKVFDAPKCEIIFLHLQLYIVAKSQEKCFQCLKPVAQIGRGLLKIFRSSLGTYNTLRLPSISAHSHSADFDVAWRCRDVV